MVAHVVRTVLLAQAALLLVVGLAFLLGADWAHRLWPWPDGRLSYLFVASMLLAQAGSVGWVALTLELQAVRGGLIGFAASAIGIAVYAIGSQGTPPNASLWLWAGAGITMAAGSVGLLSISSRFPIRDHRMPPRVVRLSFLVFAIALAVATGMLLARETVVFPWPLKPGSSVIFGFLFLASAIYFFHGWLKPGVSNASGQLIGFLIYDLVLFPPFVQHWPKTTGPLRVSMGIYLAVLFWSAVLALWFLPRYALPWRQRQVQTPTQDR